MWRIPRIVALIAFIFILFASQIRQVLSEEFGRLNSNGLGTEGGPSWKGRWFPNSPTQGDDNPTVNIEKSSDLYDPIHGIKMGIKNADCDDAKHNLEIDWDFSPLNYTCYQLDKSEFRPQSGVQPIVTMNYIPEGFHAHHRCMDEPIEYASAIPTFGTHRPLWAKYGEYTFLPRQRWLHNLEHGAIVMLYHPCADRNEVKLLKTLVKSCLYRHIISPYTLLTPERPLALLAWGKRLSISKVSPGVVIEFIRENALKGPEQTAHDGQYDLLLDEHAKIVSDLGDSNICKYFN